jgi:hypothetical protein
MSIYLSLLFNDYDEMNSDQCHKSRMIYKSGRLGKHRPLDKPEVGSVAWEKEASPADRLHLPWALFPNQANGVIRSQNRCVKTA